MDLLFESTKKFEQDLEQFNKTDKSTIIKQINQSFEILLTDKSLFYQNTNQLKKIKVVKNYDSSLYSLRIDKKIRVIFTIDEDPIFDRTLITLFRVVNAEDASQAYISIAKSLYQDFMVENQEIEVYSS
jgi:mRNA-degrading endonuclease RelE of RelBE toxin-antitoxin system